LEAKVSELFSLGPEPEWVPCAKCGKETNVSPCWDCDRAADAQADAARTMGDAERSFPASHAECRFDNPRLAAFCAGVADLAFAKQRLLHARRAVIVGTAGSGKTSLAVACARVRLPHAWFVTARLLGTARIQNAAGHGEATLVQRAVKAPLLLLDDLGIESNTATNAVPDVIAERHEANLTTWITTGFTRGELANRYGDGIARRIFEGAAVIRLGSGAQDAPRTAGGTRDR
jgi:DNA replication protein DnaC